MRIFVGLLALAALIVAPVASFGSTTYTGSLSSATGAIDGTGIWVDQPSSGKDSAKWSPFTITWEVSQNTDGTWHYSYTFSGYKAELSHLIIETSANFTSADIMNATGNFGSYSVGEFSSGGSNPNMPDSLYGIKFDSTTGTDTTISFDSTRAPMWEDFYAKSGKVGGTQVSAWSEGFLNPDETWTVDGTVPFGKILAPDTIPEPATLALLAIGGVLLAARRRMARSL